MKRQHLAGHCSTAREITTQRCCYCRGNAKTGREKQVKDSSVQNMPSAWTNTARAEGVSENPSQPHRLLVWESGAVRAAPECIPRQVSMARGGEA